MAAATASASLALFSGTVKSWMASLRMSFAFSGVIGGAAMATATSRPFEVGW